MGDGAPQDEPARLDAGDLVDLGAGPGLDELVDRPAERPRVAQQGGDVAKQNARLRVIRDGPDRGGKIGHHRLSLVALRSRMFERRSLNAPAIFGRGFNEFNSLRRHSRATVTPNLFSGLPTDLVLRRREAASKDDSRKRRTELSRIGDASPVSLASTMGPMSWAEHRSLSSFAPKAVIIPAPRGVPWKSVR